MWNAQSHQIWQKSRPVAFNLESDTPAEIYSKPPSEGATDILALVGRAENGAESRRDQVGTEEASIFR
jgi:hypothetical protein